MLPISHIIRCFNKSGKYPPWLEQLNFFNWSSIFSKRNRDWTISILKNSVKIQTADVHPNSWTREAAVLVPLCRDKSGIPCILVSLRSLNLYKHPGELCFPGGMIDEVDNKSSFRAALRETWEELGIPQETVKLWGRLPEFFTDQGKTKVTPILGCVGGGQKMDLTQLPIYKNEVENVFAIPFEHFCNPGNWSYKGESISWNNLNIGEKTGRDAVELWGLTAAIAHFTLSALLPRNIYRRKADFCFSF